MYFVNIDHRDLNCRWKCSLTHNHTQHIILNHIHSRLRDCFKILITNTRDTFTLLQGISHYHTKQAAAIKKYSWWRGLCGIFERFRLVRNTKTTRKLQCITDRNSWYHIFFDIYTNIKSLDSFETSGQFKLHP